MLNKLDNFFDNLNKFNHQEIFSDLKNIWEVVPKIEVYLEKFFENYKTPVIEDGVENRGKLLGQRIFIGKGTIIEEGTLIKEPAIIGRNNYLRQGAYLRGNVITGNDCLIGHATEVKNSLIMDGSKAPHFNYLGDSILGSGVNLGAGVILANFKSGARNPKINIYYRNQKIGTGLRKLGAILGDNVHIGCNSVLNPGTIVGKNSLIYPLTLLIGVIPPSSIIKNKPSFKIEKYQ